MFRAVMTSAVTLRKIIDSIKDLVTQVNFQASTKGISLQAMDSAHVSLVSLCLQETGFKEYKCENTITLGLNLNDFGKILKMATNDDQVTLTAESDSSYLTVYFENRETGRESEFQLNLLTLESDSLGIPESEYPTRITISSTEFFKMCKELYTMADVIQIQISDTKHAIISYSGKIGKGNIKLKSFKGENNDKTVEIKCQENVNSKYGLQYLNNFSKASPLSSTVDINLSTSFPMMIHYDIENIGFIKFYLAPKMEDE